MSGGGTSGTPDGSVPVPATLRASDVEEARAEAQEDAETLPLEDGEPRVARPWYHPSMLARLLVLGPDAIPLGWGHYARGLPSKPFRRSDYTGPATPVHEMTWSYLGAFLAILAIAATDRFGRPHAGFEFLFPSFGASAVLVFGAPSARFSQPYNVIVGHLCGAVAGMAFRNATSVTWVAAPLGMASSLFLMQLIRCVHPPGGATAIVAATFQQLPKWHGWSVVIGALVGSTEMVVIALVVNNLAPSRPGWPTYWLAFKPPSASKT